MPSIQFERFDFESKTDWNVHKRSVTFRLSRIEELKLDLIFFLKILIQPPWAAHVICLSLHTIFVTWFVIEWKESILAPRSALPLHIFGSHNTPKELNRFQDRNFFFFFFMRRIQFETIQQNTRDGNVLIVNDSKSVRCQ